jgi:hypothetical protein
MLIHFYKCHQNLEIDKARNLNQKTLNIHQLKHNLHKGIYQWL